MFVFLLEKRQIRDWLPSSKRLVGGGGADEDEAAAAEAEAEVNAHEVALERRQQICEYYLSLLELFAEMCLDSSLNCLQVPTPTGAHLPVPIFLPTDTLFLLWFGLLPFLSFQYKLQY